jgi:general secretion pathway protein G
MLTPNNGQRTTDNGRRSGFTLVELLVVIAIIAVLVGLTTAAVMKFLVEGPKTANFIEIRQLEVALENARTQFKLGSDQFPSRIMLCEKFAQYQPPTSPLVVDSIRFLQQMFPRIDMTIWNNPAPTVGIDWNGNGAIDPTPFVLEGDQCLVFFLGGIQTGAGGINGCLGFSTDPRNPAAQTQSRIGPFYEFKSGRLRVIPHTTAPSTNAPFFSYFDAYNRRPYAYFSSYRQANGYDHYAALGTDCAALGVWPYAEVWVPRRYLKPNTFQIISAGPDGVFGVGTNNAANVWSPQRIGAANAPKTPGEDDQSNFHGNQLGVAGST